MLFAIAQGTVWEHQHDEGTSSDLAIGLITRGEFVPTWPLNPVSVGSLYRTVEGNSDYTVRDAIESVTVPNYRMFHPPGYYTLLHLWTKVFGTSRLGLRLPAYLLAALAILGMVRIARRVIPEAHGSLWVALLFGLSPWVLRLTNFARPYHLALFCAVWATAAVVSMQDERRQKRWPVIFVLLSVLGLYTLYHYAFVLVWHLALIAWNAWASTTPEQRRARLIGLVGLLLAISAGFAPWLRNFFLHLKVSGNSGDYFTGAVAKVHWNHYALQAYQDFTIADALRTFGGQHLATAALVLGALSLPILLWAFAGAGRKALGTNAQRFWITATLLPLLILASDLWRGSHTIFIPKLCFGMIILLVLALVRAWLAVPVAWLRNAGLASWALLMIISMTFNTYTRAAEPSDMEDTAASIAQADTNYHLVILSTDLRGYSAPFLLSLRDAGVQNVFVTQAKNQEDLSLLLVDISNRWASRFQRVSLVNFRIPQFRTQLMWDEQFLKDEVSTPARDSKQWQVFWHNEQTWSGENAIITGDRSPDKNREMWFYGPVKARFYSNPILTSDE
ncbi:MAG: hypothetical protein ACI9EF_002059 [Pseudohongiellaceae bacterium]|jgi:hypothetical protein